MKRSLPLSSLVLAVSLLPMCLLGATFPGNACVKIDDPSGGLTVTNNMFTVSFWAKISIPSGTNISDDMTLLVVRLESQAVDKPALKSEPAPAIRELPLQPLAFPIYQQAAGSGFTAI